MMHQWTTGELRLLELVNGGAAWERWLCGRCRSMAPGDPDEI